MKYLDKYYAWSKTGRLPNNGLCNSFPKHNYEIPYDLKIMLPDEPNLTYWGHEIVAENPETYITDHNEDKIHYEFTPLRQNIVLFLAAMNNEL